MKKFNLEYIKDLSEADKKKYIEYKNQYINLAKNSWGKAVTGKTKEDEKLEQEIKEYNQKIKENLNLYLSSQKDILKGLFDFINKLDEEKNETISKEIFNRGYYAIVNKTIIPKKYFFEVFIDKDKDCQVPSVVSNCKYFMKAIYWILDKDNKKRLLKILEKYVKNNSKAESVKGFVGRQRIKVWDEDKILNEINKKIIYKKIESGKIEEVISLYKFLSNQSRLRDFKLKNVGIRGEIVDIKNKCYNRLYYHINRRILKFLHSLGMSFYWHNGGDIKKIKNNYKKKLKRKKNKKKNKKQKTKKDIEIFKDKQRYRSRLYYLLNKQKQIEVNKKYLKNKKKDKKKT